MKSWAMIITLSLSVSQISYADSCPIVSNLNPLTPPGGWQLFISPMYMGSNSQPDNFYFVSAMHSVSKTYYYQQIFCKYETCSSFGCPNFTLISTTTYQQPASNISPWNIYPVLANTVVCNPSNHDPLVCIFTNQSTQ